MDTPQDLTAQPITLEFSVEASSTPLRQRLEDGRTLFKVQARGSVVGTLNGAIESNITEVIPDPPIFQAISIRFIIEIAARTPDAGTQSAGTLEGFYTGNIYHPTGADLATVYGHGHILTTSTAYVDLFLAEVFVESHVKFVDGRSVGESGRMTLSAR